MCRSCRSGGFRARVVVVAAAGKSLESKSPQAAAQPSPQSRKRSRPGPGTDAAMLHGPQGQYASQQDKAQASSAREDAPADVPGTDAAPPLSPSSSLAKNAGATPADAEMQATPRAVSRAAQGDGNGKRAQASPFVTDSPGELHAGGASCAQSPSGGRASKRVCVPGSLVGGRSSKNLETMRAHLRYSRPAVSYTHLTLPTKRIV